MQWLSGKSGATDRIWHQGALPGIGGVDLTSPAGKMTMQVISAVAEF